MRKGLWWCTALALFWGIGVAQAGMRSDEMLGPGSPIPSFTYTDLATGEETDLQTLARGGPFYVFFLQTACRACYREALSLKRIAEQSGKIPVLGVFLDMKSKDFMAYAREYELPFSFAWDESYAVADAFGVAFTPATFLVASDGRVLKTYRGFHPWTERSLRDDLAQALADR